MSELDKYVEKIKEYIGKNPNITEEKLIRYVYLDLGNKFSFDLKFAFGNSKTRQEMYNKSMGRNSLESIIKSGSGNCKDISNILKYVLQELGVNATTEIADTPYTKCPHVYNIISQKDGKVYSVDLQVDLEKIKSHSFTKRYGLALDESNPPILRRFDIEKMDRELGYIDDEHYYADDYLYMLKSDIGYFSDYTEKIRFVLENIDICENNNVKYAERKWHHEDILRKVLSRQDLNKIQMLDCYTENNGEREYINYIAVNNKGKMEIYVYDNKEYAYKMMSLLEFAKKVKKGLVVLQNVQGLNKELKNIENNKEGADCKDER